MATYYSYKYNTYKIDPVQNRSVTLADANNVIEGGMCTWVIGTQTANHNLDIARYDATNYKDNVAEGKPVIIIKCIGDASGFNVAVRCDDGAAGYTTLYTFAADYSVTPRYIAVRLSATLGADGRRLWELA